MQKDFMTVAAQDAGLSEAAFVERYWTGIWANMGGPGRAPANLHRKPEYRVLEPYLNSLAPGARILDGGCGLGEYTAHLADRGFESIGLDISRETVAALQKTLPKARFQAGDIRATGFPENRFDLYFSWGVFEHFEDGLQPCIREAFRILKPGAHLVISVPFDNLRVRWLRRRSGNPAPDPDKRFYQWRLSAKELAGELAQGGFVNVEQHRIHVRQGVLRSLQHHLGLDHAGQVARGLAFALAPIAPSAVFAHMIVAVARKPE